MRKGVLTFALLGLSATPLMAQGNRDADQSVAGAGQLPAGWQRRVDPKDANKPAVPAFVASGNSYRVTSGSAAVYYNPRDVAEGNYTVRGTFTQNTAPRHPEAYGLFAAGHDLESPEQSYLYFLVRGDGSYSVRHRANDSTVHTIQGWTKHDAVKAADASGKATNALAMRFAADKVSFMANGTEVFSVARATLDSGGDHSGTSGQTGIRVNHNLDVTVEGFGVEK
ncbi:MAG TPA: hypothetical protein VJ596_11695 [Gemmatimonadaceae bacterium]|nr:hypothetical protein [Gemmatimonadaceae bacterium]